jgi:hypothetical protein
MKITPLIFCGLLLAVTSCNSSNNTGKSNAVSESPNTVEATPVENTPISEESKIDVPAEPVENSESVPAEESVIATPVESPENQAVEEKSESAPVESQANVPIEGKSESAPVESQTNVPTVQTVDENKIEDNQSVVAGKTLHDEQCVSCHANKVKGNPTALYTREDRKVKDLKGLQGQVERCVTVLNVEWFDSEIDSVVQYLNADFYKFTPTSNQ